jgi:hypothetical protein
MYVRELALVVHPVILVAWEAEVGESWSKGNL